METTRSAERYFSSAYAEARRRFLEAAIRAGATPASFPIRPDEPDAPVELSIDVAVVGRSDAEHTVVVTSGVHGIEGFVGSAIQLAWLERALDRGAATAGPVSAQPVRMVLIHAVNPFGFAHLRRVNEDNIDLNRNFHSTLEDYRGAPPAYAQLDALLNPPSPPSRWDPFLLRAFGKRYRVGMPALQQAIASGQHEYPRGLFYGGRAPAASTAIVRSHIESWIADAPHVIHLDLHTGLGGYGAPRLLLSDGAGAAAGWYEQAFDERFLEIPGRAGGSGYQASGGLGQWLQQRFGQHRYRFVTVEFGTYHPIRVLAALRDENRAHFFAPSESAAARRAQRRLLACFCPRDRRWRRQVLTAGVQLVEQASNAPF